MLNKKLYPILVVLIVSLTIGSIYLWWPSQLVKEEKPSPNSLPPDSPTNISKPIGNPPSLTSPQRIPSIEDNREITEETPKADNSPKATESPPNDYATAKKQFDSSQRQEANQWMAQQPYSVAVSVLIDAIKNADNFWLGIAQNKLITDARYGNEDATRTIIEGVYHEDLPSTFKQYLVELLGDIGSPEALNGLIEISKNNQFDTQTRNNALQGIADVGKIALLTNVYPPIVFFPTLRKAWEEYYFSTNHKELRTIKSLASGLSTVGTAESTELLMQSLENENDINIKTTISEALTELRNPEGIYPLEMRFLKSVENGLDDMSTITGNALASMGRPEATEVLMRWASLSMGENAINHARVWFSKMRDTKSLEMVLNKGEGVKFKDSKMEQLIVSIAETLYHDSQPKRRYSEP